MDSRILDVLEEAFGGELELLSDLGSLEAVISKKLQTLGQGLLQRMVRRKPNGYEGSSVGCSCGRRKRFIGHRSRQIHTVFGWVEIPRAYYHCDNCKSSDAPYDRAAGLGSEQISPALAKACCLLAVDDSFDESARKWLDNGLSRHVGAKPLMRTAIKAG